MRHLKKIKENLIVAFFLVFVFAMLADYCVGVVKTALTIGGVKEKIEYKDEFFELKEQLEKSSSATDSKEVSSANAILDFYRETTNSLSNFNNMASKDFFLNLNARLSRGAKMAYIPGTTFLKYKDGTLITLSEEQSFDHSKIEMNVGFIKNFTQSLEKMGINFAYVNCPNKERLLDGKLPQGFQNAREINGNLYATKILSENGIPVFDLTEKMVKNEEDALKMFYKTDHHWKTEYGIHSAKHISEYLNSKHDYNIDTDIFDLSCYDVERYEKCLLGSTGINSTKSFVDAEDFNVYVPKTECEFSFEIPSKKIDSKGGFGVFINRQKIDDKKAWPFNAYASYIYANSAYVKIENKTINDNHKILIIKDSFANAIVPYLAQAVKRVDVVDIRKNQTDHFAGDIMAMVEENDYDTVLFIYNDFSYQFDRLFLK